MQIPLPFTIILMWCATLAAAFPHVGIGVAIFAGLAFANEGVRVVGGLLEAQDARKESRSTGIQTYTLEEPHRPQPLTDDD